MGNFGMKLMRRNTNQVLDALLLGVQENLAGGGRLSVDVLKVMIEGLKNSADLDGHYGRGFDDISKYLERESIDRRRQNCFGRLMVHPLTECLDNGSLDRAILPNIFTFLHLLLGQDAEAYNERCREVVRTLKEADPEAIVWDTFYHEQEIKVIQWHTLVRIAQSFKRWDLRREWFIRLMQYQPSSVSVGSAAFVMNQTPNHVEHRKPFGNREFCIFFRAFYKPLINLSGKDAELFRTEFGNDPHHVIGPFLLHLAGCDTH